jgi:hypothetical protein
MHGAKVKKKLSCIVDIAISEMNLHKINRSNPSGKCIDRSRSFHPRTVFMFFLCFLQSTRRVKVDTINERFGIFNCTSLILCYIDINMACCGMKRPFRIHVWENIRLYTAARRVGVEYIFSGTRKHIEGFE